MRIVQQLNALIWSWGETLKSFAGRVAFAPFAIYAGVQLLVVLSIAGFAYPPFSWAMAPVLRWRFGEQALHYPNNLFALRPALGQFDMFLWVLLGTLLSGAAAYVFASHFAGRREPFAAGWRAAARRYLALVAVGAIVMAATQLIAQAPQALWSRLIEESPMRFRLVRMVSIGLVVAVQALLVYAVQYIVLQERRILPALAGSLKLAFRSPVTTYMIVGVPAALELVPLWLSRKSPVIAYQLSPELLIAVMVIWIAVIFVSAYASTGAATRFFLLATQDEEIVGSPETEGGR
jgi:hypothetical protein